MKIRTDFVTNSSSSSFLVIRITKKDGTAIVLEEEEHCFWDIPGDFECASLEDLYNMLVDGFDGETDGVEDFLNKVLAIEDIDDVVSMEIEDTSTAWEGDLEDPEECENLYDEAEYDEEDGIFTGVNTYFYSIKGGMATLTEKASGQEAPAIKAGEESARNLNAVPSEAWEELFAPWILERGRDYANSGKVVDIQQHRVVSAIVQGQEDYEVTITFNKANEVWGTACTCPHAQEGYNCKHIAAVLYTLNLPTTTGEVKFDGDCCNAELRELLKDNKTESSNCTQIDTLAGKTFVVTGDLYYYASRDVLKGVIEAQGGKLTGSVSSKTTALITNFPDSGTTKIKKAKELGIEIITEEEFIRRYLPQP